MHRRRASLVVLVAGVAVATVLGGCGGGGTYVYAQPYNDCRYHGGLSRSVGGASGYGNVWASTYSGGATDALIMLVLIVPFAVVELVRRLSE